ncbi:MAG: metallophosphoesterase [Ignavibacteria bacterium GWF2_33_9]|nr:MAG: metallophosphoesterase [Ignavibacteria bacterium GWF2_33_9]
MRKINLLFIGDIVGEEALIFLKDNIEELKTKYKSNFIIVNGENLKDGKGLTEVETELLFGIGVNVITTGNHVWENWKSRPLLARESRVIRPMNYPPNNPGYGYTIIDLESEVQVAVLQLQGRALMSPIDCPFRTVDHFLKQIREKTNNIIVDFHAETTSEKMAMAWYLDGKVSAIIGTHTHIQTADAQILPNGTAYISDVGMTGPYNSVIGMNKETAIKRMILQTPHKYELATGDLKISGVAVEIDVLTNQAMSIQPFIHPPFQKIAFV